MVKSAFIDIDFAYFISRQVRQWKQTMYVLGQIENNYLTTYSTLQESRFVDE